MVSLTIRNIPEEILKRIRILAARERRSMNSEMLIVIEDGLSARIAKESGTAFPGSMAVSGGQILSSAGREKMWTELCGEWRDDRTERDSVADITELRQGIPEGEVRR
jgi:plasmid stability protein